MNALQEQIVRYLHILLAVTAKTVIIESDNLSGDSQSGYSRSALLPAYNQTRKRMNEK